MKLFIVQTLVQGMKNFQIDEDIFIDICFAQGPMCGIFPVFMNFNAAFLAAQGNLNLIKEIDIDSNEIYVKSETMH